MGLDMYLEARRYVSGYSHSTDEEKELFNTITEAIGLQGMHDERSATVSVNVAYWRKANQIHTWFVENVQDGVDDCGSYRVSREQLTELLSLCERVSELADIEYAGEHLPTYKGSFFGSIEYGEYYFEQTAWTAERLAEILNGIPKTDSMMTTTDFYYQASW
jgi:hypothetical protein